MKKIIFVFALSLPLYVLAQTTEELSLESADALSTTPGADTVNIEAPAEYPVESTPAAQETAIATPAEVPLESSGDEKLEDSFAGTEEKLDTPEEMGAGLSPTTPPEVAMETPIATPAEIKAQNIAEAEVSTPVISTRVEKERDFNNRRNHWITTFGFEGMEYELPWYGFIGERRNVNEETRKLYGGRLGFGREFHLGGPLFTSTKIEGFYMGTLFENAEIADPDPEDTDAGTHKEAGHIFGGDIVQTLSFQFEMKTKNPFMGEWTYLYVEPFVEAGIGVARAYNSVRYNWDTGRDNSDTLVQEHYNQKFEDELTNVKIGAGINFTSRQGFMLYLKVTQNRFDVTKRRSAGKFYADGNIDSPDSTTLKFTSEDVDIDPITVFAIGGGYKF